MRYLFSIILGLLLLSACSKQQPVTLRFDGVHYYQIVNSQQVAVDHTGTNWFQLRQPDIDAGYDKGAAIGLGETWMALTGPDAGNRNRLYHRDQATFNNTNLPPVFVKY